MAKKEGALFEYGSGSEYINSVLSGERLSNNLKALARIIAGRKIKQMKSQDKDISTAKAKRAVKDAIAEAKAEQKTTTSTTNTKPKTPSKPKTTTTKSTNPGRPGGESGTRTAKKKTYKIKKGDTLSEIAEKNNTTVKALAEKNNIKDPNKIYAGNSLKLNKGGYANCGASVAPNRKSKS